ncbi:MAG TPA: 50S ribosomal protein L10 [Pseudogracilibacillus sp.]|nr:50S ribosomal protein L10 [Pseudogracilibacillus sp.]
MANLDVKRQSVEEITQNFKDAESAVVVDYRGLDVAEITALRKELRDNGINYKVYKNTMVRRAVADVELEELNDILVGPTAIAFGKEDVVAPARILYDFAKDHKELEIKGGVIQGEVAAVEQLKELSTLPDHDGLISMLLSVLQAPIRNLAYATKAIAEEKEESAE